MNNKDYVIVFKALADETRLAILDMLSKEELCACHILQEFEITQPTLSYHMKILVDSGLVNGKSINKKVVALNTEGKDIESRCD